MQRVRRVQTRRKRGMGWWAVRLVGWGLPIGVGLAFYLSTLH
ncbi:MAG TPA: hypothetical protein VHQ86_01585 [Candidatus Saccharimonadia bacterium]|nr:hypothetical protein [Candidatus Saccharimonadia bacterium]